MGELNKIKEEVTAILKSGGFELRKWLSNAEELMIAEESHKEFCIGTRDEIKVLGLLWESKSDVLLYHSRVDERCRVTKRVILSTTAHIFDPLGLIGPLTVKAKLIIQALWKLNVAWDESIPLYLHSAWKRLLDSIRELPRLRVPRCVSVDGRGEVELHAFCDASEHAYGACVYVVSRSEGKIISRLLASKNRVAPLRSITIPRLELCGAVVLGRLVTSIVSTIKVNVTNYWFWTDSQIVLCWLRHSPSSLKSFVATRVSEVQSCTEMGSWRHVPTRDNPADLLTRGCTIGELERNSLWWSGPQWLTLPESNWPASKEKLGEVPEMKVIPRACLMANTERFDWFSLTNSLRKLLVIVAILKRYIYNFRQRKKVVSGPILVSELDEAKLTLSKISQEATFARELRDFRKGGTVNSKSSIFSLDPFLDDNGVLRVGGRIRHSPFLNQKKHPIVINGKHPFAKMITRYEHERLLHSGYQTTLASIRNAFWITGARRLIRNVIKTCMTCFRINPKPMVYKMGNLPAARVTPGYPFQHVGVDYAGPVNIRDRKLRGAKLIKAYIAVFICFSTKALHVDLVTELTTDAFFSCLRRLIARRGLPECIYSDNESNFVGARNELRDLFSFLKRNEDHCHKFCALKSIRWQLIPARSPHFGGIWEAAVKGIKISLKKVLGGTSVSLTYEELQTVLCEVESCLNSRPIHPLSDDPNDFEPLTPAHFLIGRAPLTLPERFNFSQVPDSRLSSLQRLLKLKQLFWKRWSNQYVLELQKRNKWRTPCLSPKIGDLVLLVEEGRPPLQWKLGRIMEVFPGEDGVPRVAHIKTANSTIITRAVNKLCLLPSYEENQQGECGLPEVQKMVREDSQAGILQEHGNPHEDTSSFPSKDV